MPKKKSIKKFTSKCFSIERNYVYLIEFYYLRNRRHFGVIKINFKPFSKHLATMIWIDFCSFVLFINFRHFCSFNRHFKETREIIHASRIPQYVYHSNIQPKRKLHNCLLLPISLNMKQCLCIQWKMEKYANTNLNWNAITTYFTSEKLILISIPFYVKRHGGIYYVILHVSINQSPYVVLTCTRID